jgi:L-alanine-DL-glutamate epimerase-like enolase superfamily enzyme
VTGIGEVRLNIRYLHGYREEQVLNNLLQRLNGWDWRQAPAAQLAALHEEDRTLLPPSRMALDMALHDLMARQNGVSVAAWLGRQLACPPGTPIRRCSGAAKQRCWRRRSAMSIAVLPS